MKVEDVKLKDITVLKTIAWRWFQQRVGCHLSRLRGFFSFSFLFLSLFLTACGFHLRGEEVLPFAALNVAGNPGYLTVIQLKEAVSKVPMTRLASGFSDADATLTVVTESR